MNKPKVTIDPIAYQRIITWVDAANIEVCGLGRIIHLPDEARYHVATTYLPEQISSASETEATALGIAQVDYESRHDPGNLNFRWHSHVNMAAFWSATDIECIRSTGAEWFTLHLVINKKREYRAALYLPPTDLHPEIFLDELPVEISPLIPESLRDSWREELRLKNRTEPVTSQKYYPANNSQNFWIGDIPAIDKHLDSIVEEMLTAPSEKSALESRSKAFKYIASLNIPKAQKKLLRADIESEYLYARKSWAV